MLALGLRPRTGEDWRRFLWAPVTAAVLVAAIYPALPDAIRPSAGDGLLAHLIKLEREGRVAREDGQWSLAT